MCNVILAISPSFFHFQEYFFPLIYFLCQKIRPIVHNIIFFVRYEKKKQVEINIVT